MTMWFIAAPLLLSCIAAQTTSASSLSTRQADDEELLGHIIGYFKPGDIPRAQASEQEITQLFDNAGRQPNITSSVSFPFAPGNLSQSESNTTWTWTLKTTNLAVPEDFLPGGLRVVNQQWTLQWPGGGNLQSALQKWGIQENRTQELCFGTATYNLPSNITSRYAEVEEPGDCSAMLGTSCADRIRGQVLLDQYGCGIISTNFDACTEMLGTQASSLGMPRGFNSVNSSETFFSQTSPAVSPDDLAEYVAFAETRVQMLLVQDIPRPGRVSSSQLLCQVVNPPVSAVSGGSAPRLSDGYMICISLFAIIWGFTTALY